MTTNLEKIFPQEVRVVVSSGGEWSRIQEEANGELLLFYFEILYMSFNHSVHDKFHSF